MGRLSAHHLLQKADEMREKRRDVYTLYIREDREWMRFALRTIASMFAFCENSYVRNAKLLAWRDERVQELIRKRRKAIGNDPR